MSSRVGTVAQVAEELETSEATIRFLKEHRGLPHVYINRKTWVVPWKALDDWLANQATHTIGELKVVS